MLEALLQARDTREWRASLVCSLDRYGQTPLHIAAARGHAWAVTRLLSAEQTAIGVSAVDARSASGYTPLMLAIAGNHLECCRILLRTGATPTLKNNKGVLPFNLAVAHRADQQLRRLLLRHGATADLVSVVFGKRWPTSNAAMVVRDIVAHPAASTTEDRATAAEVVVANQAIDSPQCLRFLLAAGIDEQLTQTGQPSIACTEAVADRLRGLLAQLSTLAVTTSVELEKWRLLVHAFPAVRLPPPSRKFFQLMGVRIGGATIMYQTNEAYTGPARPCGPELSSTVFRDGGEPCSARDGWREKTHYQLPMRVRQVLRVIVALVGRVLPLQLLEQLCSWVVEGMRPTGAARDLRALGVGRAR